MVMAMVEVRNVARDARRLIEGVCGLTKGQALIALRCLEKVAAVRENVGMSWVLYEGDLVQFLGGLAGLRDDYTDVRKIREKARDLDGDGEITVLDVDCVLGQV
jgi:hypothetical protein